MIRLHRASLPPELQEKCHERERQLNQLIDDDEPVPASLAGAYRDPALKAALASHSHGKCIYCESFVSHVYYGDVEHIRPKSRFPREALTVSNLALACAICNGRKADYWDDNYPLLNPFVDAPEEELIAFGYYIVRKPGSERGRLTLKILDLNRPALIERRKERCELLQPLVDQYCAAPEGPLRKLLREELVRQIGDEREYALVVRAFIEATGGVEVAKTQNRKVDECSA